MTKPAKPEKAGAAKTFPAALLQVKTWIVEGQQAADILESCADHFPKQPAAELLDKALEELESESRELNRDVARGFLLNAYRELYRRAAEINDFGNALAALRSFERLTR
jgi:hypothetical protein